MLVVEKKLERYKFLCVKIITFFMHLIHIYRSGGAQIQYLRATIHPGFLSYQVDSFHLGSCLARRKHFLPGRTKLPLSGFGHPWCRKM